MIDFGISNSTVPFEAGLRRCEAPQAMIALQTVPEDETPVAEKDRVTLDLRRGEVALLDRPVLVDEAMIGRHDQVAGVGAVELFDDPDDLFDRVLGGLENALLGSRLSPIASIKL